ncbi:MAG: DUF962 domain-containing protein [Cryomorphaceae bacterium]|nr:DUF962 domain-containing protein [Cryomorphaceae bacterium]
MKTMQDWLDAYGESHLNKFNKAVHWICVPVIFVSLVGLLSLVPVPNGFLSDGWRPFSHLGTVLLLFGLLFYLRLSLSLTIGMLLVAISSLFAVNFVNNNYPESALLLFLLSFSIAWIGQFVGHKIEGKKPSFFDDLKFLLIGPAWLLSFVYRKLGISY